MSEYQYYEFVAIDRPLTAKQQSALRAVSTRGEISSSSFVNEYDWGDLKADPREWMEHFFDAHLYLANWGSHRVTLRLPRASLDPDTAARYCAGPAADSWATSTHVIVDLNSEDDDGDEHWLQPGGLLASIVPARAELAAGDMRPLYLAWLLVVQQEALDDDEVEPPVPAGLDELTGPQEALVEFLRVDLDLLAAAAAASKPLAEPTDAELDLWVQGLPQADKNELLLRVLHGDGALLQAEMLRRIQGAEIDQPNASRRTVGELLAAARKVADRRQAAKRRRDSAAR
jgi:hypothetical protein